MNISLINGLTMNEEGGLVNAMQEAVHLRQGDMDGACGPYCVVMALLVLGLISRNDVLALSGIDYRTRTGRLLKEFLSFHDPMVLQGTTVLQLEKMLSSFNATTTAYLEGRPGVILDKTQTAVLSGYPVILDVNSRSQEGLNHWTLAIGACDKFIYLLDPGYQLPVASYWNAAVGVNASASRFGYRYINSLACMDVEVNQMLVVRPCES